MIAARLALALLFVLPAAAAANPHLDRARRAFDDLEYESARTALRDALAAGDNGPHELAEIFRLSGLVAAAFGDEDEAIEWFSRWLALEPDAQLPAGLAPKILDPFATARADVPGPLRVRRRPYAAGETELVLIVTADPADMVAGARLEYRDPVLGTRVAVARGRKRIAIPLPGPLAPGPLAVAVIDEHGNHIVELEWVLDGVEALDADAELEPDDEPDDEPAEPPVVAALDAHGAVVRERDEPLYARWTAWGGTAVGLAAVGGWFAYRAAADQRELDEILADSAEFRYDDARRVERRGRRNAMVANVSLGAALACGAVSTALLLRALTRDEPTPRRRVAPIALRGGGGVTLEVDF